VSKFYIYQNAPCNNKKKSAQFYACVQTPGQMVPQEAQKLK